MILKREIKLTDKIQTKKNIANIQSKYSRSNIDIINLSRNQSIIKVKMLNYSCKNWQRL